MLQWIKSKTKRKSNTKREREKRLYSGNQKYTKTKSPSLLSKINYHLFGPTTIHLQHESSLLLTLVFFQTASLLSLYRTSFGTPGDYRYIFFSTLWLSRYFFYRLLCTTDTSTTLDLCATTLNDQTRRSRSSKNHNTTFGRISTHTRSTSRHAQALHTRILRFLRAALASTLARFLSAGQYFDTPQVAAVHHGSGGLSAGVAGLSGVVTGGMGALFSDAGGGHGGSSDHASGSGAGGGIVGMAPAIAPHRTKFFTKFVMNPLVWFCTCCVWIKRRLGARRLIRRGVGGAGGGYEDGGITEDDDEYWNVHHGSSGHHGRHHSHSSFSYTNHHQTVDDYELDDQLSFATCSSQMKYKLNRKLDLLWESVPHAQLSLALLALFGSIYLFFKGVEWNGGVGAAVNGGANIDVASMYGRAGGLGLGLGYGYSYWGGEGRNLAFGGVNGRVGFNPALPPLPPRGPQDSPPPPLPPFVPLRDELEYGNGNLMAQKFQSNQRRKQQQQQQQQHLQQSHNSKSIFSLLSSSFSSSSPSSSSGRAYEYQGFFRSLWTIWSVVGLFGTVSSLVFYGRIILPIPDLAVGCGTIVVAGGNIRGLGKGGGSKSSKSTRNTDRPWAESYKSIAAENRFRLHLKVAILRVLENVLVCAIIPQTAYACRVTGHCYSETMIWELGGGTHAITGSTGQSMFDTIIHDRITTVIIAYSVCLITGLVLLTQAVTLDKNNLALDAYFYCSSLSAAGSTNGAGGDTGKSMDTIGGAMSASSSGRKSDGGSGSRRGGRKSTSHDILNGGALHQNAPFSSSSTSSSSSPSSSSTGTGIVAKAVANYLSYTETFQRVGKEVFANELGHISTSRVIAISSRVHFLFSFCLLVICLIYATVGKNYYALVLVFIAAFNSAGAMEVGLMEFDELDAIAAEISSEVEIDKSIDD